MKKTQKDKKKSTKTLEIIALVIAILCLTIGFLAFSSHLKIQSELTAHPDELTFKIVFSSKDNKEQTDPISPQTNGGNITASEAIIFNSGNPVISNLGANFTNPGQKVTYNFYIYNAGEYTGYLNHITYETLGRSNAPKLCIAKDGSISESISKACENIKISIKVGDVTTSKSLYYINDKSLRPKTAHPVEVTIEYLEGAEKPKESFDVFFGHIQLHYSMYDHESSRVS